MAIVDLKRIDDLPLFDELDDPDFGSDLESLAEDLFSRPDQGLMRAADGSLVAYRNADLRELGKSKHDSHQTLDSMSGYWRETCPAGSNDLIEFFRDGTFSKRQPEHLALKQLIGRRLTTQSIARFKDAATAAINERLDLVADGSTIDFQHDFSKPVIGQFWHHVIGLTPEEGDRLIHIATDFQLSSLLAPDAEQISSASEAATEYLALMVTACEREQATHDLLSELVADYGEMGELGRPANPFAAFANVMVDGFHTFGAVTSNNVHALLSAEEAHAQVRKDPGLIPDAVMEGLRLHPAVILTAREAVDDFEHEGVEIPADATLLTMWLFGNRDPEAFAEPSQIQV